MLLPEIHIKVKFSEKVKRSDLFTIKTSNDIFNLSKLLFNQDTIEWLEEVIVLFLDPHSRVNGFFRVSHGGTNEADINPKVIFTVALKCLTSGIIVVHNHPSGEVIPSVTDTKITTILQAGGKLLDIPVYDHVIVSTEGFFSFRDNHMLTSSHP